MIVADAYTGQGPIIKWKSFQEGWHTVAEVVGETDISIDSNKVDDSEKKTISPQLWV